VNRLAPRYFERGERADAWPACQGRPSARFEYCEFPNAGGSHDDLAQAFGRSRLETIWSTIARLPRRVADPSRISRALAIKSGFSPIEVVLRSGGSARTESSKASEAPQRVHNGFGENIQNQRGVRSLTVAARLRCACLKAFLSATVRGAVCSTDASPKPLSTPPQLQSPGRFVSVLR